MSSPTVRLAEWIVAALLPGNERDCVIGDVREQVRGTSRGRALHTLALGLPIALHFHGEVYTDSEGRFRVISVAALGWALLAIVQWAAWPTVELEIVYPDPISTAVAAMWGAAHLTGAAAAGLLAGHLRQVGGAGADDPSRLHAILLVALGAALVAGGALDALAAAVVTFLAAWVGRRGRESEGHPTPA